MGACSSKKFFKIRCSGIASEAFLDRSRALVIATQPAEYCIQILAVHIMHMAKAAEIEFPQERVSWLSEQYGQDDRCRNGVQRMLKISMSQEHHIHTTTRCQYYTIRFHMFSERWVQLQAVQLRLIDACVNKWLFQVLESSPCPSSESLPTINYTHPFSVNLCTCSAFICWSSMNKWSTYRQLHQIWTVMFNGSEASGLDH